MFHKLFKGIGPIAAIAVSAALSGCDGVNVNFNSENAVPLSELDLSSAAPRSVALAGPDTVVVRDGDKLAITVEGDPAAVDLVRFSLDEDTLGITRQNGAGRTEGRATVRITMPSPRALTIAGSGTLEAQSLRGKADINVLGTGQVKVGRIDAEKLSVNVAGSGSLAGAGTAAKLDMNLLGSGAANMEGLKADKAKLTIAGSGSAIFASDGTVNADVMGSGSVTVVGRATCKVKSMGSGTVICRPAAEADDTAKTAQKADRKAKRSAARDSTKLRKREV